MHTDMPISRVSRRWRRDSLAVSLLQDRATRLTDCVSIAPRHSIAVVLESNPRPDLVNGLFIDVTARNLAPAARPHVPQMVVQFKSRPRTMTYGSLKHGKRSVDALR